MSIILPTQGRTAFDKILDNLSTGIATNPKTDRPRIEFADLRIRTKDRELVPFAPNAVQTHYLDKLLPTWRTNPIVLSCLREIILKARQEGISTLVAALFFCETLNTPYTQTVVVAHRGDSTEKLFQMVQLFYKHLPPEKQLPTKYASKREFYWPDIDSSYYVGTAGERDFGRASTVNLVHGSEVAFWPDARKLTAGLLQAVPEKGCVFFESTANGVGDYFNTEYTEALEGESTLTARFFPWFLHDEYKRQADENFSATPEEAELAKIYNLSLEQLAWRRYKVKEIRDDFKQEYPSNPEEAFIVTGNAYFNLQNLQFMLHEVSDQLQPRVPRQASSLLALQPRQLQLFKKHDPKRQYIIAADPSEGINEYGNHDFCSTDVLDAETLEQVAHLHGRWDTHDFGLILADLGNWFYTDTPTGRRPALLVVERNNHGHAVLNTLINICNYPKMALDLPGGLWLHKEFDERKRMRVRRPGWPTTKKTKFFALDELAAHIEDVDIKVNSRDTIRELTKFVKLPGGKAEGAAGGHDDRVMSLAIAVGVAKLRPKTRVKPKGWQGKYGEYV